MIDTRVDVLVTVPVPATRRHALTLDVRQRWITLPDDGPAFTPLQLGGAGPFAALYARRAPDDAPPAPVDDESRFPYRLRFVEPLRGFEDWPIRAQGALVAEAAWSYPIPIDSGWATSLYFFPAFLLREIDLEVFGAGAIHRRPPGEAGEPNAHHLAAGAALTVSLYLWRLPLLVQYQVARRFTDDEAVAHQLGLALGL